jgi:redox-sensitive bicupin YhaK (pirin superfamily)
MDIILLPVVGGLEYTRILSDGTLMANFLEPGQAVGLSVEAGMTYTVSNPYETETINFLQLWLTNVSGSSAPASKLIGFDLTVRNTLLPLIEHPGNRVFIGQYSGREEGEYVVKSAVGTPRIFIFILQGSFEVANRLLHERDGLSLSIDDGYVLEFEALSNDAILILLEV